MQRPKPRPSSPERPERDRERSVVPGLALRLGDVVAGRYRLEELLGCEASGVTLAARQVQGREPVLLEVLAGYSDVDDAEVASRLSLARRAALLHGAHVARVVDIARTADGMPFVATTRPSGRTLEDELARRGRLSVPEAVDVALQVSAALAEAHVHGLVHGDLEPRRVVVAPSPDGQGLHATVLGFGTARPTTSVGEASASTWFGSPSYIAPEHTHGTGAVDARADVWSVAVLVHELVAGTPPFEGESVSAVLVAVAYDAAPLLTDAPYELAVVLARCLAKDPAARVPSVEALADLLAPFAGARGAERAAAVHAAADGARRRVAREAARAERRPAAAVRRAPGVDSGGAARTTGGPRGDAPTSRSRRVERATRRGRTAVLAALALSAVAASSLALGRRGGGRSASAESAPLEVRSHADVPFPVAPFRPNVAAPPAAPVPAAALPDARPAWLASPRAPSSSSGRSAGRPASEPFVRTPPWPAGPPAIPAPAPRATTPRAAPPAQGASRLFSERR